jgi:hypothetical protein
MTSIHAQLGTDAGAGASNVAGLLTLVSPTAAFVYAAAAQLPARPQGVERARVFSHVDVPTRSVYIHAS